MRSILECVKIDATTLQVRTVYSRLTFRAFTNVTDFCDLSRTTTSSLSVITRFRRQYDDGRPTSEER